MTCYNSELPIGPPGPTGPQGPPGIFLNEIIGEIVTTSNIVGANNAGVIYSGYYKKFTQSTNQQVYTFFINWESGILNNSTFTQFSVDFTFSTLTNLMLNGPYQQFFNVYATPFDSTLYCELGQSCIEQTSTGIVTFNSVVKNTNGNFRFNTQFDFVLL